jgi:anti-sigma-K factor RskA
MDHERFEELKEAYVLGALPKEDRREFEEYFAAYPESSAPMPSCWRSHPSNRNRHRSFAAT